MGWYRPHGSAGLVWRDAVSGPGDGISAAGAAPRSAAAADAPAWDRAVQRAATPVVEDPTPAQYHDTTTTSRDRAYHLAREGGLARDVARQVANAAVEQARRTRGC